LPFVEIKDGRLYYEIYGEGPPLVLIHGAWASHQWWRWQAPVLARDYKVFLLDVRGHGQSSPLRRAYSVEGFTKDLRSFLQQVEVDEPVLIGWSMGGIISMQYCMNYPSEVKALVLIATRAHRNPRLKLRILFALFQARLGLLMDFTAPRKYDRTAKKFPYGYQDLLEKQVKDMLSSNTPKEVFEWVMADLTNNPRENFLDVIKSIWNWEAGGKLKNIRIPTLILVGGKDNLTPPHFSRRIHEAIPFSKLVTVDNAGHFVALERPEVVNTEIIKFLKSIGY